MSDRFSPVLGSRRGSGEDDNQVEVAAVNADGAASVGPLELWLVTCEDLGREVTLATCRTRHEALVLAKMMVGREADEDVPIRVRASRFATPRGYVSDASGTVAPEEQAVLDAAEAWARANPNATEAT